MLTRRDYEARPWLEQHFFNPSEVALFPECTPQCARKAFDTAEIVRDAIFHQLWPSRESGVHYAGLAHFAYSVRISPWSERPI